MKRQLGPLEKRQRIRWLILFGISAVSLLWAGYQRAIGYFDEYWYCHRLRYFLLSDYQLKHHQWPTSLDDVERDVEANTYVGPSYLDPEDNSAVVKTFRRYKPVMIVRWKTPTEIRIDVRFTQVQSFESGVDAQSALDSDSHAGETSGK